MLQIAGLIEDLTVTARFLTGLPGYLRKPFSISRAKAVIEERFRARERNLVNQFRSRVIGRSSSPYWPLLREAGIELGDLEQLVSREGVEGSLYTLLKAGVYLTVDEFKGRQPVRRGQLEFWVRNSGLVSPTATVHGISQSSGSGGPRTAVPIDLASVYDHAVNTLVTLDCHGGSRWSHSHWGRPGGTSVTNQVEFSLGGNPPRKWFTPVPTSGPSVHPRYKWGSHAMRCAGRVGGIHFPPPTLCSLEDPSQLLHWAQTEVFSGRTPHIWTFASSAVRACKVALESGLSLEGVVFTGGGEPTTPQRRATVERSGARILPRYGTTETDIVAFACANPVDSDEQHFLHDRLALIELGADHLVPGIPATGLMVSSLLPSAPITLINVSLGDRAKVNQRDCGCPLQAFGWKTHLSRILSFEKLTAGGTTLFDSDLIGLLEVDLPSRFGGGPTDYQLVEGETIDGEAEVRLLVHPDLGPIDPELLKEFFHSRMARKGEGEKLMEMFWKSSGFLKIERGNPYRTSSGKIPHIHRRLSSTE